CLPVDMWPQKWMLVVVGRDDRRSATLATHYRRTTLQSSFFEVDGRFLWSPRLPLPGYGCCGSRNFTTRERTENSRHRPWQALLLSRVRTRRLSSGRAETHHPTSLVI